MSSVSVNLINVPHSYSIESKRRYSRKTDSTHQTVEKGAWIPTLLYMTSFIHSQSDVKCKCASIQ